MNINQSEQIKWAIRVMAESFQVNEQAEAAKRILILAADRYRSSLDAVKDADPSKGESHKPKERVIPFVDGEPHEI